MDGEIVAVDERGKPSFQALQNRKSHGPGWHIVSYAFDLLSLEGDDLLGILLIERRAKLQSILGDSGVRFSAELPGTPKEIIKAVRTAGLEGIVAKRRDSLYRPGHRVESWRKLKLDNAQEFLIGGYRPDRETFQSLLVGHYEEGELIFADKVRQGFNPASRAALFKRMRPLATRKCPFVNLPTSRKSHFGEGVTAEEMSKLKWLRPELVAQCSFTEWTSYGMLRHGTFQCLREDKDTGEVLKEVAGTKEIEKAATQTSHEHVP
jgi:bifunctional non-homologous end joining protein LigD